MSQAKMFQAKIPRVIRTIDKMSNAKMPRAKMPIVKMPLDKMSLASNCVPVKILKSFGTIERTNE